jgi:predicted HicB family RNase H-like nuclease
VHTEAAKVCELSALAKAFGINPSSSARRPKSAVVRVRVSEEEQQKIQIAAQRSEQKLSDWIRKVLLDAV